MRKILPIVAIIIILSILYYSVADINHGEGLATIDDIKFCIS